MNAKQLGRIEYPANRKAPWMWGIGAGNSQWTARKSDAYKFTRGQFDYIQSTTTATLIFHPEAA